MGLGEAGEHKEKNGKRQRAEIYSCFDFCLSFTSILFFVGSPHQSFLGIVFPCGSSFSFLFKKKKDVRGTNVYWWLTSDVLSISYYISI